MSRCGRLERGQDCNFDEEVFYIILLAVFAVTTVLLIFQAWAVRKREKRESPYSSGRIAVVTRPQLSLLLAAGSSFCVFLDSFVVLGHMRDPVKTDREFTFFGSIFLFISLVLFAQRWCHVVRGLEKRMLGRDAHHDDRFNTTQVGRKSCTGIVQRGYCALAILHIPFVVIRVVQWPNYDLGIKLFTYCVVAEAVALTIFAILMCYIAFKMRLCNIVQGDTRKFINQLCYVTLLNLVEQIIFDGAMIGIHRLFFSDYYMLHGNVQAAYFSLWFAVYWVMHIQVLLFFRFVTFSDESKVGLLMLEDPEDELATIPTDSSPGKNVQQPSASPNPVDPEDVNFTMDVVEGRPPKATDTTIQGTMLGSPVLPDARPLVGVANPLESL